MTRPPEPMPRAEAAALLGVEPGASGGEVQRAYLRAARRVHPDVLGDADDADRRAAAEAFVRLSRARAAMLQPGPPAAAFDFDDDDDDHRRGIPDGPRYRRVPGTGLGGSLVVLALLAFLLVGLVSLEQAMRGDAFEPPASSSAP